MNVEQQLTDMYAHDMDEAQKQIDDLKQEVELWKNRALEAEAANARAKRQTRHI